MNLGVELEARVDEHDENEDDAAALHHGRVAPPHPLPFQDRVVLTTLNPNPSYPYNLNPDP